MRRRWLQLEQHILKKESKILRFSNARLLQLNWIDILYSKFIESPDMAAEKKENENNVSAGFKWIIYSQKR